MSSSKVSIVIPAYKARWFEEALLSALAQTHANTEIIVSDDCPTDDIRRIVDKFPGKIRYLKNPLPDGTGYNNTINGLEAARGDYIKFLFDDDILAPECVETFANALDIDPQCSMAFSLRHTIDEQSRIIETTNYFGNSPTGYTDAWQLARQLALTSINFIGEPTTVMFRRKDCEELGKGGIFFLASDPAKALVDVAMFLNLAQRGSRFFFCRSALSSFRKSSVQNSSSNTQIKEYAISEWMGILKKSVESGFVMPEEARDAASRFLDKWLMKYPTNPQLQQVVRAAAEGVQGWLLANSKPTPKCYVCKKNVPRFLPYKSGLAGLSPVSTALQVIGTDVENYLCPACRCNDRDRHLAMYMDKLGLWDHVVDGDILHFAPEIRLANAIIARNPRSYRRADLFPARPEIEKMDIHQIPIADGTLSLVICNHVLEHVSDPALALREIARVLRPGGAAILQTPWSPVLHQTFEATVTDPVTRELLFGQDDHVRQFGPDIFTLFEECGLRSARKSHAEVLPEIDPHIAGVNPREDLMLAYKA